jgi:hypothetical protein
MDRHSVEDIREEVLSLLDNAYTTRISNLNHSVALAEKALLLSR